MVTVWCGNREGGLLEVREGLSEVAFTLRPPWKEDARPSSYVKNLPNGQTHKCQGPRVGISRAFEEQWWWQEECHSCHLRLRESGGALTGGQSLWYYCKIIPSKRWSLTFDPSQSATAPIKCNLSKPSRQEVSWEKVPGHPRAFPGRVFSRISIPGAAKSHLLLLGPGTHTSEHQKWNVLVETNTIL